MPYGADTGANGGHRGPDVRYDPKFCGSSGGCMSDFPLDHSDGDVLPQSDRLQILSPEEYELLWGFPRFTQSDRGLVLHTDGTGA